MSLTNLRRERPVPSLQRQLEASGKEQRHSQKSLRIGPGIFAAATLVGISIIATELLVIATPSMGFAATFILLVLGALMAGYMLACAMVRIFRREE
jgi:hypothetical protein